MPSLSKRLAPLALATTALLFGAVAHAQHAAKDPDDSPGRGKFRAPTKEEQDELMAAIAPRLSQSSEGLTPKLHTATGATMIELDERFESVALARVAPDGTVVNECVTTESEAKEFLQRDLAKKPAKHDHDHAPKAKVEKAATTSATALEEK